MQGFIKLLRKLLYPIAMLYGGVVFVRNKCYAWGIFASQSFTIPVVCVGNITVGGTGKTPHTEYFIRQFSNKYKIAVLSRGYGRKTKGFRFVEVTDSAENVGDEPLQMKQKFPEICVAVDERRARGIQKLQELGCDLVLLDDAFQHRSVSPSKSIVLMDYNRLPQHDCFLPTGNLRDGRSALQRADFVFVTKCPQKLTALEKQNIIRKNKLNCPCFFTHFEYGKTQSFAENKPFENFADLAILLVTGIANPKPLEAYLKSKNSTVKSLYYADHYDFKDNDLQEASHKIIVTTEKDKVKLLPLLQNDAELLSQFYYLPIKVAFETQEDETTFLRLLAL